MAVTGESSVGMLFDLLRAQPRTTRTDLVRASGLSKATVSESIASLIGMGFIAETGKQQRGRGRSQVVLELKADARLVIGVQFSETGCHAVLANLRAGKIAAIDSVLAGTSPDAFADALIASVEALSAKAEAPILGVGVGVPGLVAPNGREVIESVPYGWNHVPIAEMLEPRLNLPVIAANRAKAAALGEYWQGGHVALPAGRHLAYLHMGSGIVAGFVIDGKPFYGSAGASGEIGHITIQPDGPLCGCGNRGCLHMLASESAIIRAVRQRLRRDDDDHAPGLLSPGTLSIPALVASAKAGNQLVLEVVAEVGSYLGLAIATVLNLMNPSTIVIGGPIVEFGEPLMAAIRAEVKQRALWEVLEGVSITASVLGDDAGTLGAAALFLDQLDVAELMA
jgi:predicted NBD/HSP70 family sugar kinase